MTDHRDFRTNIFIILKSDKFSLKVLNWQEPKSKLLKLI